MSCDKVLMVSYKKNGKWNKVSKYSKERFEEMGFDVDIIEGYNYQELIKYEPIKRNQLVYKNILEIALDKAKNFLDKNKKYKGVFIAEDDAWITLSLGQLKKKVSLKKDGNIKWVGYQKKLKTGNTFFYVGAQLIWIPRNKIKKLTDLMMVKTPQHFNGFLSKNIQEIGIDIMEPGLVQEIEHRSLTLDKVRSGKKINGLQK